ncbi:MAG: hypothetical protein IPM35_02445 [Myxococcales bacterium]|nr:hypothetical protein [Myxococcales bacterium]
MLDTALAQLVAAAVAEAQRPLVAELAAVRAELGEVRRGLVEDGRGSRASHPEAGR